MVFSCVSIAVRRIIYVMTVLNLFKLVMLFVVCGIVTGCRSYRYTGFDRATVSYPRDMRLVVTNLVLKVEPSLDLCSVSMSESWPYESHSVLQSAKAGGEDVLMQRVNERLTEFSDETAKCISVGVVIESPEVEVNRSFWGYILTLSLIFPAEQFVDERSNVLICVDNAIHTGSIHVRGEGRCTVYSPWGLLAPDAHPDAAYTQTTSALVAPSWGTPLSPFFPLTNPGNDVLACDLADVLLSAYHKNKKERIN